MDDFIGDAKKAHAEGRAIPADWPELETFDAPTTLPELPVDALPTWVAEMVHAVAASTGFDPSMGVGFALGALSCAAQGRLDVAVSTAWVEQVCLYIAIVAEPGEGKSPVYKPLVAPLHELDQELSAEESAKVRTAHGIRESKEAERKEVVKKLGKAQGAERHAALADLAELDTELDKPPPSVPRLLVDDVTAETLGQLMPQQGERLACLTPEDHLMGHLCGRYHKSAPPIEIFLKSYTGESVRVDRRDRTVSMKRPCLTICSAMQPSVLSGKGMELADGRGLLARFVFVKPPRRTGYRNVGALPKDLPAEANAVYRERLRRVTVAMRQRTEAFALSLSPDALVTFLSWRSTVEPRRRDGGDLSIVLGWAAKAEGLVLRLSALLWLGDGAGGDGSAAITAPQVSRAIRLFEAIAAHTLDALGSSVADAATKSAHALVQWLERNRVEVFTVRDVRRGPGRTRGFLVAESIRELERRGYVRSLPTVRGAGRPTARYESRLSSRSVTLS
jgi:hypothetical protein